MTHLTSGITNWRKSSASDASGDCVEYGSTDQVIAFRDTKEGRGLAVVVGRRAGAAFVAAAAKGAFGS